LINRVNNEKFPRFRLVTHFSPGDVTTEEKKEASGAEAEKFTKTMIKE
jgi:hypothetical protein